MNQLPGVSCATPKGAFYAFPNIKRTGWKAKALASALLEDAGVAIIGGPDFGILGEGYVRLSYANSTENIRKALDRMGEFLLSRKERCLRTLNDAPPLRRAAADAAKLPRVRGRRRHSIHPEGLAARMADDAGGPASSGDPRWRRGGRHPHARRAGGIRRPRAGKRQRGADLRAHRRGDRARRFRPRRQAGAELEGLGAAAQSRAASRCRRNGSSASSRTRNSCSPTA